MINSTNPVVRNALAGKEGADKPVKNDAHDDFLAWKEDILSNLKGIDLSKANNAVGEAQICYSKMMKAYNKIHYGNNYHLTMIGKNLDALEKRLDGIGRDIKAVHHMVDYNATI